MTALAIAEVAELEPLPPLELKGKEEPFRAVQVVALHGERSRERALGSMRAPMLGRDRELAQLSVSGRRRRRGSRSSRRPASASRDCSREFADACDRRARLDIAAPARPAVAVRAGRAAARRGRRPRRARHCARRLAARRRRRRAPRCRRQAARRACGRAGAAVRRLARRARCPRGGRSGSGSSRTSTGPPRDLLAFLAWAVTSSVGARPAIVATARPILLDVEADWVDVRRAGRPRADPRADARELVHALVGDALPDELVKPSRALRRQRALHRGASALVGERRRARLRTPATGYRGGAGRGVAPADGAGDLCRSARRPSRVARAAARRACVAGRRFPTRRSTLSRCDGHERRSTLSCVARWSPGRTTIRHSARATSTGTRSFATPATRASRARSGQSLHLRLADWLSAIANTAAVCARRGRSLGTTLPRSPRRRRLRGRRRSADATTSSSSRPTGSTRRPVARPFAAWERRARARRAGARADAGRCAIRTARRLVAQATQRRRQPASTLRWLSREALAELREAPRRRR